MTNDQRLKLVFDIRPGNLLQRDVEAARPISFQTDDVSVDAESAERVHGEDCIPPIPAVGYRPSLYECNGAAAVLMRGLHIFG